MDMLYYFGTGTRWYAEKPVPVYRRKSWEFQAVVSGRIAMTNEQGPDVLRKNHLWLFAPSYAHGWTGEPGKPAEVVVFHFLSLPEPLRQSIPAEGYLEMALDKKQTRRLQQLAEKISRYWRQPRPDMILRHEHALLELSLLTYDLTSEQTESTSSLASTRVQDALKWFNANIHHNPSLEDVAQRVSCSVAHLRRHFHEIMNTSPKKIFDQIRFQRALQLMANSETKLQEVSDLCGFENPSSFSRAFKTKFGCSPDKWRA